MTPTSSAEVCPVVSGMDELFHLDPDRLRCPFPAYSEQRADGPVAYSDRLNAYVVTRHDDVLQVLMTPEKFSSRMAAGPVSVSGLAERVLGDPNMPERTKAAAARRLQLSKSRVLIYSDPPLHRRQRSLVGAGFTPRRVAELDGAVDELAAGLVNAFERGAPVDVVPAFSIPIPMTVIATLLGIPPSMMATFKGWSNAFTRGVGAMEQDTDSVVEMFDQVTAFYDYFVDELNKRRSAPVDDLLSDLLAARMDGEEPLAEAELLQMLVQFLVAGNETTTNLLTSAIWKLAQDEQLQNRLRHDPQQMPAFVDEVLRIESPIQGVWRVANEDVAVGGTVVPEGGYLYAILGAANHDQTVFTDPEQVGIDQGHPRNLAFGRGEHVCLGMNLAKLEAKVALNRLLAETESLTVHAPEEQLSFHRSFVLHGITSLLIHVR